MNAESGGSDNLRQKADRLEARLKEGQPGRRLARERTVGRLVVSGRLGFQAKRLAAVRAAFPNEPDTDQLCDLVILRLHGWRTHGEVLVGPRSWPGEDVDEVPLEELLASLVSPASGGQGSGGTISRGEARRQVQATREWEDWASEVRRRDLWAQAQKRREWMFGQFLARRVVMGSPDKRDRIRGLVAEDGIAAEIELWTEDDIRPDYTPEELGAGG